VRILRDLKSFVLSMPCVSSEVFILIGLKSFVLIQIREFLEVLILRGLGTPPLGSADSKEVRCDCWLIEARGEPKSAKGFERKSELGMGLRAPEGGKQNGIGISAYTAECSRNPFVCQ
jgi:hypothetical protein